jgi:23S rRNA G2445 N2-methylase RlmL
MRVVSAYFEGGRILDPFAGTGTMLIERSFYNQNLILHGVDIYGEAVKFADENLKAAGVKAQMFKSDILNFKPAEKYDEIISNMPYGLRVSTHKENEMLYEGFLRRIPELLKDNGVLILLTADYTLLKDLARKNNLQKIDEFVIESGGLLPHLIILNKTMKKS